jgi:hypothetical protein
MDNKIEKLQWSEKDFDKMGWHDSHVYALAFNEEDFKLVLDIDYILEWVHPIENETYFKFWVAPATLVFKQVRDLNIDFEGSSIEVEIEGIQRVEVKNDKQAEYNWTIETGIGSVNFKSTGFEQFIRRTPELISNQKIGLNARGGISFTEIIPE